MVQIVGDDLLVTNPKRIEKAFEGNPACNALLLKVNQIGTVSEAIDAFKEAKEKGWGVMIAPKRGDRGLFHRRSRRGAPCRADQDRSTLSLRASCKVQPVVAHRGGA